MTAMPAAGCWDSRLSVASNPVLLHSGNGLVFAHRRHLGFAEADSREEQVDEIGRKRFRGRLGCATVRLFPIMDACPERCLIDFELVSEDMAPEALAVGVPVHRVGNPRSQDPPVMELELVADMVRAGLAACVPDALPAFDPAEGIMGLMRRRWPGHRAGPASHSRSCSSSLRLISCTRPQFPRWLGACRR